MKIHNVKQGSAQWLALRADYFTASEAPAMMGVSKYKTRAQLLHEKKTGLMPEVDEATQARFDRGHATEEAARKIVEERMKEELFPVTATEGKYLASVDGLSLCGQYAFEHKLWNKGFAEQVNNDEVPETHVWQLEQILLVTGAVSVLFVVSDGTPDNWAEIVYKSNPEKREALLAGWEQFEKDLAEYEPPKHAEKLEATPVKDLPAITYTMNGLSLSSNLDKFKAQAQELIEQSRLPLVTDQDFADREALNKVFKEAEDKIKLIQDQVLGEIEDVAAFSKEVGHVGELIRQARLAGEKLVKARKEEIKLEILNAAKEKIQHHVLAVNNTLDGVSLPAFAVDIAGAMKGKKTVQSLHDAANVEVARAKIEINAVADNIRLNLKSLDEHAGDFKFLFADLQQLVTKDNDSFVSAVKVRVMEHKEAEAKRIAAEKTAGNPAQETVTNEPPIPGSAEENHNQNESKLSGFELWWDTIGSGITPHDGDDMEEHARRVAKYAFDAGQSSQHQSKAA